MFFRLPCEELGDLAELDLTGAPSSTVDTLTSLRLPDPWQSPRNAVPNLRDLKLWLSDNFHYKSTFCHFTACSFLVIVSRTLVICEWDTAAMFLGWQSSVETHSHSHNLTLSGRRACATPGCTSGTAMVSLFQLGLVFSLMVPYLMKPTTWQVYLLNKMYHHTTASFSTASPSAPYLPRARYNQEEKKKEGNHISDSALLRFQNCEGKKISCSFPWKDGSYQKTLTTTTALFMSKNLVLLVLFVYTAVTARCQTQRKVPDAEHISKQS